MLKLFFWLRYLRKKKIVLLSIAAVALSCALLITVSSLFNGFINAFEQSAIEVMGDVVLSPPTKFTKYQLLVERLEQIKGVDAATAILSAPGLLHLSRGDVRAVQIWGIEPGRQANVTGLKQSLIKQGKLSTGPSFKTTGSANKPGAFVGIGVFTEPDEKTDEYDFNKAEKMVGQDVVLTTGAIIETKQPSSSETEGRFKRKSLQLTVKDIVFSGIYELDRTCVYLPIKEVSKILYPNEDEPVAQQIQIRLVEGAESDLVQAQIRGMWENFAAGQLGWGTYLISQTTIDTSRQLQSQQVAEFRKQMRILLFIFSIVSFSVVLLIGCIFYMIITTKLKDIAIMKSCGAASSSVLLIFVGFGACVGIIGTVCGTILSYIVTKNINIIEEWIGVVFGLKLWKSSVYVFSKIPNQFNLYATLGTLRINVYGWQFAIKFQLYDIIWLAIVAATVGSLIPSFIAVKTRPVDFLRYE